MIACGPNGPVNSLELFDDVVRLDPQIREYELQQIDKN